LKVGCRVERIGFNVSDRPHITEMTTVDDSTFGKDAKWFYSVADDFLEFHGFVVYSKGQFATIIPQEETKKDVDVDFLYEIQYYLKAKNIYLEIDEVQDLEKIFLKYHQYAQLNQNENNELVNSSDEIKNIIVVDFENVSQKENPQ